MSALITLSLAALVGLALLAGAAGVVYVTVRTADRTHKAVARDIAFLFGPEPLEVPLHWRL